jgi:polyhydroxybutyrate depolymerase
MHLRRRVAALGALLVVVLLAGCAQGPTDSGPTISAASDVTLNLMDVGGVSRTYLVRVPEVVNPDRPLPVLVVLHGAGGDGARAETATGFTADADLDDFIVVYPYGTQAADIPGELSWNAGACCGVPQREQRDDIGFISAMLDEVIAQHPVDESRIYLTGFSNGGMLTYRLSCEIGERFAAIAVVAGALNVTSCEAPAPKSVLIIHGTADQTVPYDGGETNERTAARFGQWTNVSVADSTAFWRDRDDCDTTPVTTVEGTTSTDDYQGCADDTILEVISITDGNHSWPREETQGFDASAKILAFFQLG